MKQVQIVAIARSLTVLSDTSDRLRLPIGEAAVLRDAQARDGEPVE